MTVRIGQLLDGKYRVVRVLGKGGMGAVYEGENTLISRRVAIKVLLPELLKKRDVATRFELEAQAAGRIQNDHINEVLDLGTLEDGARFIVLEFLEGETLKERVKRVGRLTPMQAVHIVRQVLVGLSAAHRAGIVHRDLKPGNVFILWEKLGQRDFVKIIDFGVSKFLMSQESQVLDESHANAVLGTPHYMAPEQLRRSGTVDARADLYSVGIILYKAVTGHVPYHAQSV
ncbi:MAG TPA: serine/threonine-protein kinase, partial [Polyangiaceae bacterium]|nr:serine/threonine-protein kinase [Polyangiaceae bacterium]